MAVELFLRLDGVTGGTKNAYHKGWSDLQSWRWDAAVARGADGREATQLDRIVVVRRTAIDSPALLDLLARRARVPVAEIAIVPAVTKREAQQKLIHIRLEEVAIDAIAMGGVAEDAFFTETVTLAFARVHFEFSRYIDTAPGADPGAAENYTFGWDVPGNTTC
jgi:type VI secretion system secreted protein Hcp